jgi:hypothetical protein
VAIDPDPEQPVDPSRGGHAGPVLVVADNEAIARLAPRWAARFAASGRVHRVRLLSLGSPSEIAAVVAEARSLPATVILAAGDTLLRERAARVAGLAGLPLMVGEESADG